MTLDTLTPTYNTETFDRYVMQTYGRFPIALERGKGCRVWDTQGRAYLDFVAGIATCTLGHAHPAIIAAVTDQIQKLQHVSNLYYIPEQGALAQWLVEHSCADRVFFCNSGAEANEGAIKLARKYASTVLNISEPVIITAQSSFHGRTLATVTATGQPKYHKNFNPLVPGFHYVPYNDLEALETAIAQLDQDQPRVAAILIEPLQGEGGVNPGEIAYFQRIREICDEKKILLMLDEVQVGMGRSGKLWGHENLGIEPDAFTVAKGLGGGIPIGALLVKSSCNVFQSGDHASTFGGNPFVCRVGLTVAETLEKDGILENVLARGEQLRAGLGQLAERYPQYVAKVRGWGLINGLVLQPGGVTAIEVVKAAMDLGLLLVPAGTEVVRYVPPLIVSEAEIDEAIALTNKVFSQLA
ncbi:aspartate aminotransferase family protein [Prochlorothrix hollandica]|uniref:Acetylornithine aminotransferase n=1 Tax=Prochlorothrix hollandica PCC 9006 = CALU 1027 TaxID=317619 RepID=A0A0M2PY51_PROHO|nr:aspartate aminotransferase family protein [Prochlorothrix hollandica]KKJ01356.1 acetylornithine aminotransferase [Prochlorothrix hollandica PCC 9006 = CALU 1027]